MPNLPPLQNYVNDVQAAEETPLIKGDGGRHSSIKEEEREWILTTASLSCAMLVQSYLLVGVFPYSGFLAMHLIPGLTEETAGSYAGLIASSFMVGRTFSSFQWGKSADKYGRTFVIKTSLLLSAVFSVLFGLAPTFPLALMARFVLGLSNGMVGTIKTIITEVSHEVKTKETKTMAIVMGMWGYGFLLNPAISGYLSDPVKQYPNSELVGVMGPVLRANPFLLPNVVGSLFCLAAFGLVHSFVKETLPVDKRHGFGMHSVFPCCCASPTATSGAASIIRNVSSWGLFKHLHFASAEVGSDNDDSDDQKGAPRWIRPSPSNTALVILSPRSSGKVCRKKITSTKEVSEELQPSVNQEQPATIRSLWQRQLTRQHLMVYWVYSFLVISVDETFPLYCISKDSGLGIEEKMIGNLLSGTGFFYVTIQYFLLTKLVDCFGFYKSLRIGALFSIPLVSLVPISLITNMSAPEGTLRWSTLAFLCVVYAAARAFSSVTFANLTMTTNRTVPAHQRATMNGLSMLGGSLAKGIGPAFAGVLFSVSVGHITPPFGSVVAYSIIAFLGICLYGQTFLLQEHEPLLDRSKSIELEQSWNRRSPREDKPPPF